MEKSIRLKTTPGEDRNIQIKVDQDFDFLEILSLKISQQDLYTSFCANYGVVVGRVIANKGFGVPNAKVSIFVPISGEDEKNELIKDLYPYKTVNSKNKNNYRYNLLLSKSTCSLNKATGTFPTKEDVLNNDILIEIFDKYYKYTTRTNDAGDYMIFGVPTGQQTVHMDIDLSDAGVFSVRPYDFIENGYNERLFESRVEFKSSSNLDGLPQIKSGNKGIDVIPFWGDIEQCQVGVTRVDFDTNFNFEPRSVLMGSIFSDQAKNNLNKRCNPTNDQGSQCELRTGPGVIDIIRVDEYKYDSTGKKIIPLSLEEYVLPQGVDSIDENGVFVVSVPMNVGHVITDEYGNLIPSYDKEIGVPTKGMYRFKLKFQEPPEGSDRKTAQLIIPALNRKTGGDSLDVNNTNPSTENARWSDDLNVWKIANTISQTFYKDFHEFNWNQIYSISQYIPKYKRGNNRFSFIGLKGVDECGENQIFPFNNAIYRFDILFVIMNFFITMMSFILRSLIVLANLMFCFYIKIKIGLTISGIGSWELLNFCIPIFDNFRPFRFIGDLIGLITLPCENPGDYDFPIICSNYSCYHSGCANMSNIDFKFDIKVPTESNCTSLQKLKAWECCAKYELAISRKVIKYTFHDAWLTGSAYMYQFEYKSKTTNGVTKDQFCGPGGDKRGNDLYSENTGFNLFGNAECCSTRGINATDCAKCLVRGPKPAPGIGSLYHNNYYQTGASDTDDYIYCPETTPTKIVNLGRMDACEDVLDKIKRCIVSNNCLLDLFKYPGCPGGNCYTGTNYETGYDTEQWSRGLPNTSYQNPVYIMLYHLKNVGCDVGDLFKTAGNCGGYEIKNHIWQHLHEVSKLYTDIILKDESQGDPLWQPGGSTNSEGETVGFFYNSRILNKVHPTGVDNDINIGYGGGTSGGDGDHFRNTPYFYFGLYDGKTAMDRLRKEYLTR